MIQLGSKFIVCFRCNVKTLTRNFSDYWIKGKGVSQNLSYNFRGIFFKGNQKLNYTQRRCFAMSCHHDNRMVTGNVRNISITNGNKELELMWNDGSTSKYHGIWLRFSCPCTECRDHNSNACRQEIASMPLTISIKSVYITEDGLIRIEYNEDRHTSEFSTNWLKTNCYSKLSLKSRREDIRPTFSYDGTIPELQYADVCNNDEGIYRWLTFINERGLCLIKNTPTDDEIFCYEFMQSIGPVMNTSYGPILEAVQEETPYNMANTSHPMEYHMDLPQYESAPGIQSLHCIRFDDDVTGGETIFIDMLHVAEEFRKDYPEEFLTLTKVPSSFMRIHYDRSNPVHHISQRPLIMLDSKKQIVSIKWNPHLNGPLLTDEEFVETYYRAYVLFARQMLKSPTKMVIRLRPGDFMTFNNRRMAHRRTAFQNSKNRNRLLKTSYVNIDDYRSRLMTLHSKFGNDRMKVKWIGNNDWI